MNPFKKAARIVTAPVHAVKDTVQLLRLRNEGQAALNILDEGAADPARYQQPTFWVRALTALRALALDLPLPASITGVLIVQNWKTTVSGVAALLALAAKVANGHFDPTTDIAIATGAIGLILAKDHDVTGGTRDQ